MTAQLFWMATGALAIVTMRWKWPWSRLQLNLMLVGCGAAFVAIFTRLVGLR